MKNKPNAPIYSFEYLTLTQIAERLDCTQSEAAALMKKHGLAAIDPERVYPPGNKAEACYPVRQAMTAIELARLKNEQLKRGEK